MLVKPGHNGAKVFRKNAAINSTKFFVQFGRCSLIRKKNFTNGKCLFDFIGEVYGIIKFCDA